MSIQFGPEWRDLENRLTRYPQVAEANLRRALTASLLMIEADAKRNVRQDTRRLGGSINHEITGAYPNLIGRVGPSVQYGVFVEFGRKPGRMPPVNALLGWVRRHAASGSLPRAGANRDRILYNRAFALARAIGRRGIPPRPFMGPAYRRNEGAITALFGRLGARVVGYLAGGPL
jgi:phage gpG-like protein